MTQRVSRARSAVLAAVLSTVLVLSACGGDDSEAGEQTSVPVGASKEQFVEALSAIDPVTLRLQVLTPAGSLHAMASEAYAEAVSDWSGGQIDIEVFYSGSVAATDIEAAVANGAIDIAPLQPAYNAEAFPTQAFIANYMFFSDGSPVVGTLQDTALWTEIGFDEAITAELERGGLQPLLPLMVPSRSHLFCGDKSVASLADADGAKIRVSTTAHAAAVEAIGGTTVTLPTAEIFEGLQRGVVDCALSPWAVATAFSLATTTKNWSVDPTVQFSGASETLAIGKRKWDSLPLAARQLLWDKIPVYLQSQIDNNAFANMREALAQAAEAGVAINSYDEELRSALRAHFDAEVEAADENSPSGVDGAALVAEAREAAERWKGIITDELGYADEASWADLAGWLGQNELDTTSLVERLTSDVLAAHRPAGDDD